VSTQAKDVISKARARLVYKEPALASILMRFPIKLETCGTACTDGRRIMFDPNFAVSLPFDQLLGVLLHETLHIMLGHPARFTADRTRDHRLANAAMDYVVNPTIKELGYNLPACALLDPRFTSAMSWEHVYSILAAEQPDQKQGRGQGQQGQGQGQGQPDHDPGGCGGVEPLRAPDGRHQASPSESAQWERELKAAVTQAAQLAKRQGRERGHLARMFDSMLEPMVSWDHLRVYANRFARSDYSWTRPSKRMRESGWYFPECRSVQFGTLVVALDTSGSVTHNELSRYLAELRGVHQQLQPEETIVIYCDQSVNHIDRFGPRDTLEANPKGGGGTDFRPVFAWLDRENIKPDALIYITDLCCDRYPDAPDYPVLWATTTEPGSHYATTPPFGEVMRVNC